MRPAPCRPRMTDAGVSMSAVYTRTFRDVSSGVFESWICQVVMGSGLGRGGAASPGGRVSGGDVSGGDVSGIDTSGGDVSGIDASGIDASGIDASRVERNTSPSVPAHAVTIIAQSRTRGLRMRAWLQFPRANGV